LEKWDLLVEVDVRVIDEESSGTAERRGVPLAEVFLLVGVAGEESGVSERQEGNRGLKVCLHEGGGVSGYHGWLNCLIWFSITLIDLISARCPL